MPFALRVTGATRLTASAGGVANIKIGTEHGHPFKVGDKVNLYGLVPDVGTVSFSRGNPYTVSAVGAGQAQSFIGGDWVKTSWAELFVQLSGLPANYQGAIAVDKLAITAGTAVGNTLNTFRITTASPHNLPVGLETRNIGIQGVTGGTATPVTDLSAINQPYLPAKIISGSVIEFQSKPVTTFSGIVWTTGSAYFPPAGAVVASVDSLNPYTGQAGASGVLSNGWTTSNKSMMENDAVNAVQDMVANFMSIDFPLQRLCYPFDSSKIFTTRTFAQVNIAQPPSTWRSIMDSIVEVYQGNDAKKRRYWIDADGIFNYAVIDDTKPLTSNAPYKITMVNAGSPNSTTASSVSPFDLSVSWSHDTTKRALFSTQNTNGQPINDFIRYDSPDALGTAATRKGAPTFDELVEYPTGTTSMIESRQRGARAYMLERAAPVLTGQFTLRGAGTTSWNNLGYTAGYATVSSQTSITLPIMGALGSATKREVTATDYAYMVPGMAIDVSGFTGGWFSSYQHFNGSFTITGVGRALLTAWDTGLPIRYTGTANIPAAVGPIYARNSGYAQVVVYALFERTGTAPNQIVTATLPRRHNLATGAVVTVSGLTGTAGTSMNGTVTATVTGDYTFTYPSAGTNGTAAGSASISAITYVPNWQPGQWVSIEAPELLGAGAQLYRVEEVEFSFEPGSYTQEITVTFNRRNPKLLTRMLKGSGYFR